MKPIILLTVSLGLFLAVNPLPSRDYEPALSGDNCTSWEIYGYRIGMPKDEALAVRKTASTADAIYRRARVKDKAKLRLWFSDKQLLRLRVNFKDGALSLRGPENNLAVVAALTDRLGPPLDEKYRVYDNAWLHTLFNTQAIDIRFVTWESVECNTIVIAEMAETSSLIGRMGNMFLHVRQYSTFQPYREAVLKRIVAEGERLLDSPQ